MRAYFHHDADKGSPTRLKLPHLTLPGFRSRGDGKDAAPEREPGNETADPHIPVPGEPYGESAPGGRPVQPVVVPRWVQLVLLPLALLGLWRLAVAAGSLLLILVFAGLLALILNPLAKYFQRAVPRPPAIVGVYAFTLAVFAVIGILLSNPISTQIGHFTRTVPSLTRQANRELATVQRWLDQNGIRVRIEQQGQTALTTVEKQVLKSSGSIVSFSKDLLGKLVTLSVDLVLVIVLSIYLLVYAPEIGRGVRRIMPPGNGTPEDDFPLLVQRAVAGYVRGQLSFSLIMGASATVLMEVLGLLGVFPGGSRYALFFGAFYGLMELIPYIGPFLGPIPAVLVALFVHPISAVWVAIAFVVLQQLEGHVVAPQVFRISLRINPILVILSLLLGYQLYGIAGALVALPLATVTRQTVLYLRKHLVLESWSGSGALPALGRPGGGAGAGTGAPEPCSACGSARAPGDMFCSVCGADLRAGAISAVGNH